MPHNTIFKPDLFKGKVALITGGGTGIGLATARELAALGAHVAICSRKGEHLEKGSKEISRFQQDHLALTCNTRDIEQVTQTVETVKKHFGKIDILVNNAGGQFPSLAKDITPKGWHAVVDTNLNGTWNMTQSVVQQSMMESGGVIINIILVLDKGCPGVAHSGAARSAVSNLTKSLSVEWAQHGIRVVSVAPGTIKTEGLAQYPPNMINELIKRIPWGRTGTPEEIASSICFLASPAADFCTGEVFTIDGGARLFHDTIPVRKLSQPGI